MIVHKLPFAFQVCAWYSLLSIFTGKANIDDVFIYILLFPLVHR